MEKRYPLMNVKWVDPHSIDPWTDINTVEMINHTVNTIGYLIKETESMIALAGSVIENHSEAGSIMIIPRHAIVEQFEMEVK